MEIISYAPQPLFVSGILSELNPHVPIMNGACAGIEVGDRLPNACNWELRHSGNFLPKGDIAVVSVIGIEDVRRERFVRENMNNNYN